MILSLKTEFPVHYKKILLLRCFARLIKMPLPSKIAFPSISLQVLLCLFVADFFVCVKRKF